MDSVGLSAGGMAGADPGGVTAMELWVVVGMGGAVLIVGLVMAGLILLAP